MTRIACECESHPDTPCSRSAYVTVTRKDGSVRRVCDLCDFESDLTSKPLDVVTEQPAARALVVQPPPVANEEPAVWDLVLDDIKARDEFGVRKYGVRLQPNNGRDYLADAYQEALDLVVYLRGAIFERDGR